MSVKTMASGTLKKLLSGLGLEVPVGALRNYLYDLRRFLKHSSARTPEPSIPAMEARVIKYYHMIEKGLALPEPRLGFGKAPLDILVDMVPRLEAKAGPSLATRGARGALKAYVDYHDARDFEVRADVRALVESTDPGMSLCGGTLAMTREEMQAASAMDFDRFARARYSVRNFTGAPVPAEDIEAAVATAMKSPRVCNRESRRVYVGYDPEMRTRMLSYQNGNRGFGHLAGAVIIVTSDTRYFTNLGERNQPWIDGGLFAMSLVYALHGRGLGTCMLNWSKEFWRDADMRRGLGIPDHEVVITYIAVGRMPETFEVAVSDPPEIDDVLTVLG